MSPVRIDARINLEIDKLKHKGYKHFVIFLTKQDMDRLCATYIRIGDEDSVVDVVTSFYGYTVEESASISYIQAYHLTPVARHNL